MVQHSSPYPPAAHCLHHLSGCHFPQTGLESWSPRGAPLHPAPPPLPCSASPAALQHLLREAGGEWREGVTWCPALAPPAHRRSIYRRYFPRRAGQPWPGLARAGQGWSGLARAGQGSRVVTSRLQRGSPHICIASYLVTWKMGFVKPSVSLTLGNRINNRQNRF